MALITQIEQWYLVSTERSTDNIQILANRLAGSDRTVNLLDTYFSWNILTQNYDRLSVSASATLEINRAYWIYVKSSSNTLAGKVIDGYVKGANVRQEGRVLNTVTLSEIGKLGQFIYSTDSYDPLNNLSVDFDVAIGEQSPKIIIGEGGYDSLLQKDNELKLMAFPRKTKVILLTPLNTLVVKHVENAIQNGDSRNFETLENSAITNLATDLDISVGEFNFDPIREKNSEITLLHQLLNFTARNIAELNTNSSLSMQQVMDSVMDSFINVSKKAGSSLDITSADFIKSVINDTNLNSDAVLDISDTAIQNLSNLIGKINLNSKNISKDSSRSFVGSVTEVTKITKQLFDTISFNFDKADQSENIFNKSTFDLDNVFDSVILNAVNQSIGQIFQDDLPSTPVDPGEPVDPVDPVDTTPPDAPSDLVASNLNTSTPTITGKAEANSTVKLLNGDVVIGTDTADSNGNFSITTIALEDGDYILTATATDAAGNVSEKSDPLSITIDAPPDAPTITTASLVTNDTTPTITGKAEANSTVKL